MSWKRPSNYSFDQKQGILVQLCTSPPLRILWRQPKPCICAAPVVTKYQKRISGPWLDRIDTYVEVPRVDYEKLSGDRMGESSESIRVRVQATRDIQIKRYSSTELGKYSNSASCRRKAKAGCVRRWVSLIYRRELSTVSWGIHAQLRI